MSVLSQVRGSRHSPCVFLWARNEGSSGWNFPAQHIPGFIAFLLTTLLLYLPVCLALCRWVELNPPTCPSGWAFQESIKHCSFQTVSRSQQGLLHQPEPSSFVWFAALTNTHQTIYSLIHTLLTQLMSVILTHLTSYLHYIGPEDRLL